MIDENFDYAGLIKKMEDHIEKPRFLGLLDTYNCKATCLHPDENSKVIVTMQIEDEKMVKCGFECEDFPSESQSQARVKALIGQSSLYLESAFNASLSETFILAGNLLKQIKDDTSSESRNGMLFLTAYKDCVEAYYEKEKEERITTLTF